MTKPTNGGGFRRAPKTRTLNQRTNYVDTEPWTLIAMVKAGDREAFGTLYERYHGEILAHVLKGQVDYHTAEDLAAEVFAKLLRNLLRQSALNNQGVDPVHYLHVMARNGLVSHYRRTSHDAHASPSDCHYEVTDLGSDPADQLPDPQLIEALRRLPLRKRQTVVLRVIFDLSVEETARVMGISEGAVKSGLNRGLKDLAEMLRGDGVTSDS